MPSTTSRPGRGPRWRRTSSPARRAASSLDEIQTTLDQSAALDVPDRGDDYGATVWAVHRVSTRRGVAPRHLGTSAQHFSTSALRHSGTCAAAPSPLAGRRCSRAAHRRRVLARAPQRGNRRSAAGPDERPGVAGHRGHPRARRPCGARRALRSHRAHARRTGQQRARPPRGHLGRAGVGARPARGQPPLSPGRRRPVSRARAGARGSRAGAAGDC